MRIKHQNIVPYTPQQNSVVQGMNHISMEHARSMLSTFGLDNGFWVETVNIVVYLINISPTATLDGKIP